MSHTTNLRFPSFVSHNSVALLDQLTTIQHPFLNSKVPSRDRVNMVVAKFKVNRRLQMGEPLVEDWNEMNSYLLSCLLVIVTC